MLFIPILKFLKKIPARFLRMSPERYDHLLSMVHPLIAKQNTRFRKAITSSERLAFTLRFLATGESQISLTYLFRMGRNTVSKILRNMRCNIPCACPRISQATSHSCGLEEYFERVFRNLEPSTCTWCY